MSHSVAWRDNALHAVIIRTSLVEPAIGCTSSTACATAGLALVAV
jgi:hypothetical protein